MRKWRALIMGNGKNQGRKNVIWNMIGSLFFALASIVLFAAAARAAATILAIPELKTVWSACLLT